MFVLKLLSASRVESERDLGLMLTNCILGSAKCVEANIPDVVQRLCQSAAHDSDRWSRWPIMPHCIDNWIRQMHNQPFTYKWKQFCESLFHEIGGGNAWLLLKGPRSQGLDRDICKKKDPLSVRGNLPVGCASTHQKAFASRKAAHEPSGVITENLDVLGKNSQDKVYVAKWDEMMIRAGDSQHIAVGGELTSWDPDTSFVFEIKEEKELWEAVTSWLLHYASCDKPPELGKETLQIKRLAGDVADRCTKSAIPYHSLRASKYT
jgi:hypothetical protein